MSQKIKNVTLYPGREPGVPESTLCALRLTQSEWGKAHGEVFLEAYSHAEAMDLGTSKRTVPNARAFMAPKELILLARDCLVLADASDYVCNLVNVLAEYEYSGFDSKGVDVLQSTSDAEKHRTIRDKRKRVELYGDEY